MLKIIFSKFFRVFLLVFYLQRGATVNKFKSITSPEELHLQKSKKMQLRIEEFQKLVRPLILPKNQLKRYGSLGDGGYVLPINAVKRAKYLVSGGIEKNNHFEVSLARLGIVGIQIDNSINHPPLLHKNLTFIKATLGNLHEVNIDKISEKFPRNFSGILKLDIEGAEYSVLRSIKNIDRYNAIAIELHNLYMVAEDIFWKEFKLVLLKLNKFHEVVYISPNNCCGYTVLGGIPVPNVMEITWAKKSLVSGKKFTSLNIMHPKGARANYPNDASLDASGFFPYLSL